MAEDPAAALKACSAPSSQCTDVLMLRPCSLIASKIWNGWLWQVSTWLCCTEAVCEATSSQTMSPRSQSDVHSTAMKAKGPLVCAGVSPIGDTTGTAWVSRSESWLELKHHRRPRPRAGVASESRCCWGQCQIQARISIVTARPGPCAPRKHYTTSTKSKREYSSRRLGQGLAHHGNIARPGR